MRRKPPLSRTSGRPAPAAPPRTARRSRLLRDARPRRGVLAACSSANPGLIPAATPARCRADFETVAQDAAERQRQLQRNGHGDSQDRAGLRRTADAASPRNLRNTLSSGDRQPEQPGARRSAPSRSRNRRRRPRRRDEHDDHGDRSPRRETTTTETTSPGIPTTHAAPAAARRRRGRATAGTGTPPAGAGRAGPAAPAHRKASNERGRDRRALPPRGPAGLRRHVDRAPRARSAPGAPGGGQAAGRAPGRRPRLRVALPARGAGGRAARAPQHRPGLRLRPRRAPRPVLHRDGVHRRLLVRGNPARRRLGGGATRRSRSSSRPARASTTPTATVWSTAMSSPGNLLRSIEGEVKLADFGIAKATEQSSITQVGSVLGTAAYLAPEQARGEEAGPSADLYALGVVTYQLISGRLPYEASSLTELALKQQREQPAMLDTLVAAVSPELAERGRDRARARPAGPLSERPRDGPRAERWPERASRRRARAAQRGRAARDPGHQRCSASAPQRAGAPTSPRQGGPSASRRGARAPDRRERRRARRRARAPRRRAPAARQPLLARSLVLLLLAHRSRRRGADHHARAHESRAAQGRLLRRPDGPPRRCAQLVSQNTQVGTRGPASPGQSAMLASLGINVNHLVTTSGYPLLFVLVMARVRRRPDPRRDRADHSCGARQPGQARHHAGDRASRPRGDHRRQHRLPDRAQGRALAAPAAGAAFSASAWRCSRSASRSSSATARRRCSSAAFCSACARGPRGWRGRRACAGACSPSGTRRGDLLGDGRRPHRLRARQLGRQRDQDIGMYGVVAFVLAILGAVLLRRRHLHGLAHARSAGERRAEAPLTPSRRPAKPAGGTPERSRPAQAAERCSAGRCCRELSAPTYPQGRSAHALRSARGNAP